MEENNGNKKNGSWKLWVGLAIFIALVIKNNYEKSLPENKQARLERAQSLSYIGVNAVYDGVYQDCLKNKSESEDGSISYSEDEAECDEWAKDAAKDSKIDFDQMLGVNEMLGKNHR